MESNTVKDTEQYVQFAIICVQKKKKTEGKMLYVHEIALEGSFH